LSKKKKVFSVEYVGPDPSTEVIGLGVFERDQVIKFEDPDQIDAAEILVKTNVNFKEVEK
jgi:hypothetical protein